MTDRPIPESIMREARAAVGINHRWIGPEEVATIVARALMAERERAARIVREQPLFLGDVRYDRILQRDKEIEAAILSEEP